MNKIGTITFHWNPNYGATLQAYALQKHLINTGWNTEIIDYHPLELKTKGFIIKCLKFKFKQQLQEHMKTIKFKKFWTAQLNVSSKKYYSLNQLKSSTGNYSAVICGSDQIWNESFLKYAEIGHPTPSYYLGFVDDNTRRISYATSFGTEVLNEYTKTAVIPELSKFHAISTRENTGGKIVNDMGINAVVTLDPTLLLDSSDYEDLIENIHMPEQNIFAYILHGNQSVCVKISDYCKTKYNENIVPDYYSPNFGVYEWLYRIKNSKVVITNSFHGTVFAIIFKRTFLVTLVEGSGMNDRIISLLGELGLLHRIVYSCDQVYIDKMLDTIINWNIVEEKLNILRESSFEYLNKALAGLNSEN